MLKIIRNAQLEALGRAREAEAEDALMVRLRREFKKKCEPLDEDALRARIKLAKKKCATYRLEGEDSLIDYLDLTFRLGEAFDEERRYRWVKSILTDFELAQRSRVQAALEGVELSRRGQPPRGAGIR